MNDYSCGDYTVARLTTFTIILNLLFLPLSLLVHQSLSNIHVRLSVSFMSVSSILGPWACVNRPLSNCRGGPLPELCPRDYTNEQPSNLAANPD